MSIIDYGWDEYYLQQWDAKYGSSYIPARVIADYGQKIRAATDKGEVLIQRSASKSDIDLQIAVGDWLAVEYEIEPDVYLIKDVLKRKTKFSRAAVGIELKEQIVAANIDTIFIIQSLDNDFNTKRLERYLIAVWESGAMPVIVLTKSDSCDDTEEKAAIAYSTAPGVNIHAISSITGEGIDSLMPYLAKGKTIALIGSSGVGKSTLVNTIAKKDIFKTQQVRQDDSKGRHTTTHRELVLLDNGCMVLDTPGMRSLALWEADSGMATLFADIEELAKLCYFKDCAHKDEPNCAIKDALANGILSQDRWNNWSKLQKELMHLEAKKTGKIRLRNKKTGKMYKSVKKFIDKQKYS